MATRPDSNVRPARRPAAQSARAARRFALARLLLGIAPKLLLLAVLSSSMPACIIPVGPSWQDPPGDPDSAPEIQNPMPTWGDSATATPTSMTTFAFTLLDPNANQTLWVRWIIDGGRSGSDIPIPPTGVPSRPRQDKEISCLDIMQKNLAIHRIVAVVGDGPLSTSVLVGVENPNDNFNAISWPLNVNCIAAP